MKKAFLALLALCAVFMIASCASTPTEEPTNTVLGADGTPRPDWVKAMSKKGGDVHYEVGYGNMSTYATSLKRAEADARNKVALWLKADVNVALSNYTQDAGIAGEAELIQYMEEVSKQTAEVSLSGAEMEDSWEDAEHGVYVLMSYNIDRAAQILNQMMTDTPSPYNRNESAAFAEFKAAEALKALEAKRE